MDFCVTKNPEKDNDIEIVGMTSLNLPSEHFGEVGALAMTMPNLKPYIMLTISGKTGAQAVKFTFRIENELLNMISDGRATQRAYQVFGSRKRIENKLDKEAQKLVERLQQK